MARSGTSVGTVVRWDGDRKAGVIELTDLRGDCSVEAATLHPSARGTLRAGQVVEVEWAETGDSDHPFRADRVTPRDDLQATPGG
jgi:CspA family cold shock protein